MNKIVLIGNLTADVESRSTTSGVSVSNFTVAVNRRKMDENGNRQADYFKIVAWRQLGDLCAKYLAKGKKVCVLGRMEATEYTDKNGISRRDWQVIADEVEFLSSGQSTQQQKPVYTEVEDTSDLPF